MKTLQSLLVVILHLTIVQSTFSCQSNKDPFVEAIRDSRAAYLDNMKPIRDEMNKEVRQFIFDKEKLQESIKMLQTSSDRKLKDVRYEVRKLKKRVFALETLEAALADEDPDSIAKKIVAMKSTLADCTKLNEQKRDENNIAIGELNRAFGKKGNHAGDNDISKAEDQERRRHAPD